MEPSTFKSKKYGLIGSSLSHSFSKKYFIGKFQRENLKNISYELFEMDDIGKLPDLIECNSSLMGLNVTIPFKESVIPLLDELDESARSVGAVNTIKIIRDKNIRLTGYNTDVYGFQQSIKPFLESAHERALILGTGGASKAVAHVLKQFGISCLFASRNPSKENHLAYEQINEMVIKSHLLIINASPVGMYPNIGASPFIPYEFLSEKHFLYDLVYNPEESLFLKLGREKNVRCINGLSMLQLQAEKSWEIWNE